MNDTFVNYENLERRYNSIARKWRGKLAAMGYPEAYRELLSRHLSHTVETERQILDAGAGTGAFSEALIEVIGPLQQIDLLDISTDMLLEAERRLRPHTSHLTVQCGPLESLRADAKYDLILCAHVVEHCPVHLQTLATLQAALKPDGQLILVASKPHWCTILVRLIWGHKAFRPVEMSSLLTRAGFTKIQLHPFKKGPPSRISFGYSAYKPHITEKELS